MDDAVARQCVFFISDHTGITAENLGRSLLSQFRELRYETITWPFVDSLYKSTRVIEKINHRAQTDGRQPIVFMTLVDPEIRRKLLQSTAYVIDLFGMFTEPLEEKLGMTASHDRGRYHGMSDTAAYYKRIHAVNFALANDDGAVTKNYHATDLILLGVSRSGKTPTCLYLGMQHGVLAANYPLTDDDLERRAMPGPLIDHQRRLFGLTIDPVQLQRIRQERRSQGKYASIAQCIDEVQKTERLYRRYNIPFIDTTAMSVEEISATILNKTGLKNRIDSHAK